MTVRLYTFGSSVICCQLVIINQNYSKYILAMSIYCFIVSDINIKYNFEITVFICINRLNSFSERYKLIIIVIRKKCL